MVESQSLPPELEEKHARLKALLAGFGSVVIAYSGGVDSSLLSLVAHQALGDKMLAVMFASPVEAPEEVDAAQASAEKAGFPHRIIPLDDLENPDFSANSARRCYFCKQNRLALLNDLRDREGFHVSAEGSNADDAFAYRPGSLAVKELGVRSPLAEVGLTKKEIRLLGRHLGLPVWDKPSAPCLATRFPYGTSITREGLEMVAGAEKILARLGFTSVRVRLSELTARIEVNPDQISRLVTERTRISPAFKALGIKYVTIDLDGYRSGSMDEVL